MMIKNVQNAVRVDKCAKDVPLQSPVDNGRFISPEVYRFNRQKYLRSYTFECYDYDGEDHLSAKKQSKWLKNKKKVMKMKKTNGSLRHSFKTCLRLLFSCFHV
ncbi:unnamed protein product [Eruca vesicaria subsp. sativa]|uniref:Uncharacterized protein n=1 Tax=Eruca vesicaria subsp. sativa TaxID=29727 RepID=A0ABC8JL86_ERUVS|nr:unnamed protein product [Eruca vesicaria subsp. sativa]